LASANPIRTGFAVALQQPGLVAAEIAWRWSFGAAVLALAAAAFFGFLEGVVVTDRDLLALGSSSPDLMSAALVHMFEGAGPRMLRALLLLVPAIALLWVAIVSVGRAATLRTLIEDSGQLRWSAIVLLHILRAFLALAAIMAGFGVILFAFRVSTATDADGFAQLNVTVYLLILLFTLPTLILLWSFLNWVLSLAVVFVVRDGTNSSASVACAVRAFRDQQSQFTSATVLFGLLRLLALTVLLMISMTAAGTLSAAGLKATVVVLALVALSYFVIADFLHIARLASYVDICRPASTPGAEGEDANDLLPYPASPVQSPVV
jgi:hypothetical protein